MHIALGAPLAYSLLVISGSRMRPATVATRTLPLALCAGQIIDVDAQESCGSGEGDSTSEGDGVSLTDDDGVRKLVLQSAPVDASVPTWGALVYVRYTCAFENGTVFDRTHETEPFELQLNAGKMVEGLQRGVETMRKGEVARLTVAPRYAYGEVGAGNVVPANATLRYEVELLDWELGPEVDNDELDMETYRRSLEGRLVASGSVGDFSWEETGEELILSVGLRGGQRARDILVDFNPRTVRIEVEGGAHLSGELRARVIPDECYWLIDDDGDVPELKVYLAKKGVFSRWNGLFQDIPSVTRQNGEDAADTGS